VRFLEEATTDNDQWDAGWIPSEGPQHWVRINESFYLGKHEVTQAQWQAVMGHNPAHSGGNPAHPVEQVSWNDIQLFLAMLNDDVSKGGMTFVLPTEAQWEYACRAGTTTCWYCGDSEAELTRHAWFGLYDDTRAVGVLHPNGFGLHDMHGNVWEWCSDWWDAAYYKQAPMNDPNGPSTGSYRVNRGGARKSPGRTCRAARRHRNAPDSRGIALGFRLAGEIPYPPESKPKGTARPQATPDRVEQVDKFREAVRTQDMKRVEQLEDERLRDIAFRDIAIKNNDLRMTPYIQTTSLRDTAIYRIVTATHNPYVVGLLETAKVRDAAQERCGRSIPTEETVLRVMTLPVSGEIRFNGKSVGHGIFAGPVQPDTYVVSFGEPLHPGVIPGTFAPPDPQTVELSAGEQRTVIVEYKTLDSHSP
jgi:hypothetical protein